MAQLDTGLGWSAKSEWLLSVPGTVGSLSTLTGGVLLPTGNTVADCAAGGYVACTYYEQIGGSAHTIDFMLMTVDTPAVVVRFPEVNATNPFWILGLSRFRYIRVWYDRTSNTYSGNVLDSSQYGNNQYYGNFQIDSSHSPTFPAEIPTYANPATAFANVQEVALNYNKLNPGYAVACVAQWYTTAGTELISPILISNDPASTILTTDGTTPAAGMTTFDFLMDGMRFYMSLIGGNSDPVTTALEYADLRQFAAAMPQKVFTLLASDSFSNIMVLDSPDPYGQETGPSGEEGGGGDSDIEDDPVDEETMPIPAVSGLGFSTIYVPTAYDLQQLASYLWGGNLNLDTFLKLFANPMDSILGLSAVPVSLSGTYESIYMGGQILQGVTMPRYTGRTAIKVDMGSTSIAERWGSYLDYDPYTEFSVYLPFVGIKNIKADDIMGKTISLMYDIDILSGACVAYIRASGGSVLYEWAGQCAMQIPITGANWDNIFSTAISAAVTLGGAMVAPASAPMLAGSVASAAVQAVAAKPRVERSGAVTGVTGFLGQLRPYIIRTTPEAFIPEDQNAFIGYPAYITVSLASVTGYNEVDSIHLEHVPATGAELEEIESILKGGVIF